MPKSIVLVGGNDLVGQGSGYNESQAPQGVLSNYVNGLGKTADYRQVIGSHYVSSSSTYYNSRIDFDGWGRENPIVGQNFGGGVYTNDSNVGVLSVSHPDCDKIIIGYYTDSNYGSFQWRVNGGAWNVVDQSSSAPRSRERVDVGALTLGANTVEFQQVSGKAAIHSVEMFKNSDEVVIYQAGFSGLKSSQLLGSDRPWYFTPTLTDGNKFPSDVLVLMMGQKELVDGDPDGTLFESDMTTFLSSFIASNPTVPIYLIITCDIQTVGLSWLPASINTLAAAFPGNVNVLDVRSVPGFSDWSTANSNGYMLSSRDLNDSGLALVWTYLAPAIFDGILTTGVGFTGFLRNANTGALITSESNIKCSIGAAGGQASFSTAEEASTTFSTDENGGFAFDVPTLITSTEYPVIIENNAGDTYAVHKWTTEDV